MHKTRKENSLQYGLIDGREKEKASRDNEKERKKERNRGNRKTNIKQSRENNDKFFSYLKYIIYYMC